MPAGVYAAHQVVTALAMGAAYAAPYVGRMTDAGKKVRWGGGAPPARCCCSSPSCCCCFSRSSWCSVPLALPGVPCRRRRLSQPAPLPLVRAVKGLEEAARMQKIVDLGSNEGGMRLLVASVRSAEEVAMLAAEGCNTFTISPAGGCDRLTGLLQHTHVFCRENRGGDGRS